MEESSSVMVKLTSSNYSIWKPRMEDILYCKDLYEPIQGDDSKPEGKTYNEREIMNRKLLDKFGNGSIKVSFIT